MTRYRRDWTAGGTWFYTVNLADRASTLLVDRISDLRSAFRAVRTAHPFRLKAIVVLPDHLHCIWSLPAGDADYALRWRLIKAHFSRHQVGLKEPRSSSRFSKQERGIWQRRYWEHRIRDQRDFNAHADYVHINPLKHGHVRRVRDWPWSSFHRHVRAGLLPIDWGGATMTHATVEFGERD